MPPISEFPIQAEDIYFEYPTEIKGIKSKILSKDEKILEMHGAINGINLKISNGEKVGLIGLNGAGKSTLLKLIAGIYIPSNGFVLTDGRIGCILGDVIGLETEMSGYENIESQLIMYGVSKYNRGKLSKDIADFSEIGDYLSRPVKTYSAGMRLKLAFSIVTSQDSEILLIDEAISAGDINFMNKAAERFESLLKRSKIIVMSSHNLDVLKKNCTRIIWLEGGRIIDDGRTEDVLDRYERTYR